MLDLIAYVIVSFVNVFLHIFRSILVIKSGKLAASFANCITYTFSVIVIKYITEYDYTTAILVALFTNFFGCYAAMYISEKYIEKKKPV